jgi:hypothetical protein
VVPGASEFTIQDLGRVVFEELSTDRAADSVRFGGGVCLEVAGQRLTIRAQTLQVEGVTGDPWVIGEQAEVRSDAYVLGAARLRADAAGLRLEDATLEGEGIVGLAAVLELRVADGLLTGEGLTIATPSLRVDLAEGSFDGRVLSGRQVALSTCDCPPQQAGVRLEGGEAWYTLETMVLEVERGALVVGGVRLPLPARFTLSEQTLANVRPPFSVARDERRGWLLSFTERVEAGVRLNANAALSDLQPPRVRSTLVAADGPASLSVAVTSGGLDVRTAVQRPLPGGLILRLSQRLAGGLAEPIQDARIGLSYGPDQALTTLAPGSLRGRAEIAAALTAQRRDGQQVVTPRALTALRLEAASATTPLGTLRVRLEAGATGYAVLPGSQHWWAVTPRWDLRRPRLSVSVSHVYRGVVGRSPFDDKVDLVEPLAQSAVQATLLGTSDAWRLDLDVRYGWRPDPRRPGRPLGFERLRIVGVTAARPLAEGGPTLRWSGALEVAGWLDPRVDRDAYARMGVRVVWPDADPELSVEATVGLVPGAMGLRELTLAAGAPLRWPHLELRPYLALDVWPTLQRGAWPIVRGHGLGIVWESPYGTLDASYRSERDGSVTSSLAFRVELRDPSLEDLRR